MPVRDPDPVLTWRVRPFDEDRKKGIAAAVIVLLTVLVVLRWGGPLLGIAAAFLLAGGVGPFFVATEFRLTSLEVSVRSPFQRVNRPWSAFRRAYVGRQGVSLSPFRGNHLLEPYRSVMLRYGTHREEILTWVRRYGPAPDSPGAES